MARSRRCGFGAGDVVVEGEVLLSLRRPATSRRRRRPPPARRGVDRRRPAPRPRRPARAARAAKRFTADASRPEAVAKRHALGLRTARENIADLCDAGSFVEYGALAFAAQQRRRALDDLIRNTPADGMVTGIGSVNAAQFGAERSRAVVMAYDATVLAGTQGMRNHQKTDRMLGIAREQRLPVVLFAEGGGGRPGDVDMPIVAGLHVTTFASFAAPVAARCRWSASSPAAASPATPRLLGCCDVIIATARQLDRHGRPGDGRRRRPRRASSPRRSARATCSRAPA